MSDRDVRSSCARRRLPRLRCWIIHRQRDERRHDLHALQFRLLLPWNNERDLRALLGWKVVPEWSVHLQRLRAREAYEYDWVKQLPELRDGKSGEFDGCYGVRRLHPKALELDEKELLSQSSHSLAPERPWKRPGLQSSHFVAPVAAVAFPVAHF